MKVVEFRDICEAVRRSSIDYHACINDAERVVWLQCARARLHDAAEAECARATAVDRERMELATQALRVLIDEVAVGRASADAVKSSAATAGGRESRASKYNRSPGRAVRLRRATRSAMRRGYF